MKKALFVQDESAVNGVREATAEEIIDALPPLNWPMPVLYVECSPEENTSGFRHATAEQIGASIQHINAGKLHVRVGSIEIVAQIPEPEGPLANYSFLIGQDAVVNDRRPALRRAHRPQTSARRDQNRARRDAQGRGRGHAAMSAPAYVIDDKGEVWCWRGTKDGLARYRRAANMAEILVIPPEALETYGLRPLFDANNITVDAACNFIDRYASTLKALTLTPGAGTALATACDGLKEQTVARSRE